MSARWRDAARILCVRLDNLGDVLMTTPAIRALKQQPTGADGTGRPRHVTLLGSSAGCEIARQVPEIDATIAYDAPWVAAGRDMPLRTDFVNRLSAYRFEAAVIFTCYSQSALPAAMLCGQAGIPLRLAHSRENPYGLLTDWVRDPEPDAGIRHEVERQLALVETVGAVPQTDGLSVRVAPAAQLRVAALLAARGVAFDRPYVVMHPGATASSRRWPAERFAAVAASLSQRHGCPVLVTGTPGETDVVASVVGKGSRVHDLAGALSLDELVATIDGAALLVSNNSGPVHIAAACGTPVVDVYALTNPQHTPWRVAHRVLSKDVPCSNCRQSVCTEPHHACLTGVTVDEVVDAAGALLPKHPSTLLEATDPSIEVESWHPVVQCRADRPASQGAPC